MLSIIVPCYNEEQALPIFYKEVEPILSKLTNIYHQATELYFVDDGSSDNTLAKIKELKNIDPRIHYISFSRNFGKEAAVFAGLEAVNGDYVAIMDVDLQDPPALLPEMMDTLINSGKYDCVATRRVTRKGEPPIRSFFARMFYRLINNISKTEIVDGARDFRMMTKQMTDAILSMKEYNRFLKGIYGWVGFNTKWLEYENIERSAGSTKWSFWKLFIYSIEGIISFSTVPLAIASIIGLLFCAFAFIALCAIFIRALVWGDPVAGWPSLVCVITFIGGIQMLGIGIIGLYLSKAYLETKRRPIYITKEKE